MHESRLNELDDNKKSIRFVARGAETGNMDIKAQYRKNKSNSREQDLFTIRKACISDVEDILVLINGFAELNLMLSRGPQYLYENIKDFVVAVVETEEDNKSAKKKGTIVACGSMHVLWKDVAEIRSLTTHPDFQMHGLGKRIIERLIEDARYIGVKKVFALTLAADFFKKLGFILKEKEDLPYKIWGECRQCPKYFNCDEVGVILEL